jgi:magnesium transporter
MIGNEYEVASHVVICEGEQFIGLITIERLLVAQDAVPLSAVMDIDVPVVAPGTDQEIAARRAVEHDESALAVVDSAGRFQGLVPPPKLLAVLMAEHEEDLSRLGGFLQLASQARASSEEPVQRRFRHRLPWLLVGLAGALFAADIVGWFESQLRQTVMLAFFIPGVVYLADAVGTQTETIVVRGLSVGVPLRAMVSRELLAGVAIGVALAAIASPLIWWRWGDARIAVTVGLSLAAACSVAALVALALPALFSRAGRDPAFGSGPLATVTQDLLSIVIYLGIAVAVLK